MLARTLTRTSELGLRVALGASRAQLTRQLLAESFVLAALGGAAGVLMGRWVLDAVVGLFPDFPSWVRPDMDWRFAVFVVGLVSACAVVAGLIPARHVLRGLDVRSVLGPSSRQLTRMPLS